MSKYRIVKHQAGDVIGYCPEMIVRYRLKDQEIRDVWTPLINSFSAKGDEFIFIDTHICYKDIKKAKALLHKFADYKKPPCSSETVYEYDTENQ